MLCGCILSSGIQFTKAAEPPERIDKDDGGGSSPNGASYRFYYQLVRLSYDPVKGTAKYKLGQYFVITGGSIPVVSDKVYLTNRNGTRVEIGEFSKHNGSSVGPGTYERGQWFELTLVEGVNKIIIEGQYAGNNSGDAEYEINIEKFGHDPVVHGVNGTWTAGEISSGKRTWQSLYTDGATGSENGNKTPTSTGFFYSDADEHPSRVASYVDDVPLSKNAALKEIQKQNSNGTWTSISLNWGEMDKVGVYRLRACTKDQAGNEACGYRTVTVQQKKYEVKYIGNNATGGSMSNSSHTYDVSKNLTANAYTRTGYHFDHWNTKADNSGTTYANQQSVKNLSSTNGAVVNLYARWSPNTYSVVYNGNGKTGGTMSNSSHTYDQTKSLSANQYTKTGYTFTAWNTKSDGSGAGYVDEKEVKNLTSTNGAKVNLYARWKANTYSVVYNGNGKTGGMMSNSSHTYDQAKNLSANQYTKTGYTFKSWNTKADGSGTTYTNAKEVKNLTSTNGAKINLYAQWTPNTYTVKYNGNHATSGITADTAHTYDVSKALRENDYLRDGWKYMGWNTKADGTGTAYANQQSVKNLTSTNGAVVNLYAQWNKAPSLITTNKVFYENEISEQTWLNDYRMKNIRAVDLEDGDISDDIRIIADYVDVTKPGNYQVYYEVTDSVDQKIQESSTVTIKYNNPPIIQAENQVYQLGSITQEQWSEELRNQLASANDVEDGNITNHIQITLDETNTALPGVYRVKYEVTDRFGKKGEKLITVEIRYNQAPQIEADNIMIYEDEFTNAVLTERLKRHASAHDFEDGDLSSQVQIIANNVDTHTPGNYEVTYQVTDSQGAVGTKTIDVTVLENYQPILQLHVSNKRFIEGEYTQSEWEEQLRMAGVSAHDREDHDLTDQIQIISDNTDPQKRGDYEVVYTVSDRFGKSATKTAKVTVEPNEAPIIYANDKYFTTSDMITDKILLKNVYASDDHDTDINKHITVKSHNIVSGKAGVYEVTYEAVDSLGKKGSKKIQVHIIESTEPPITPPLPEDEEALYLWNGHEHGLVNITKLMEQSDLGHDIDALQDVVFGIYAKEDIIYQNQVVLKAGSLVAITQADEYGQLNAIIHHKGKYVLKELKTNDHYVLDDKEYTFEFKSE